jgi:hypothetical protein
MNSKANGCWPIIVVAGILALGSASARAAENTDQRSTTAAAKAEQHGGHHAHHASRARTDKHAEKAAARKTAETVDRKDNGPTSGQGDLPPTVANAQAQMAAPDAGGPAPGTSQPSSPSPVAQEGAPIQNPATDLTPGAGAEVPTLVAADELNDLDRAVQPEKPSGKIFRPMPQTPYLSNPSSEDTWNQTSLIGKVFIVLGGCLTLASAARMFVA